MPHFISLELGPGEYTFDMEEDHRRFCMLFEELVGDFLEEEGGSLQELYDELEERGDDQRRRGEAGEIMDVVFWASDFHTWADDMKKRARDRLIGGY